MTVPSETGITRPTPDGATSTFSVPFYFQDDDDLEVIITSSADVDTTLTKTTHYTVSGAADPDGGSITLLSPYNNLAASYSLIIRLKPALNNSTSLLNSGRVTNAQLQAALDRISQRQIRQQQELDRCIKLPWKETPTSTKTTIADVTDRTSKNFSFDSSGNPSASTTASAGSLSVTAIGESIVEAANAGAVLDALNFSAFGKSLIDDASAAVGRATLGIDASSGNIATGDLAASAVTTAKIADANVTDVKLANSAVAHFFQARLTLTSGAPVTSGDVSGGTIYLTPFRGNKIALYNGTIWKLYTLTEISLALTATDATNYDVWVYDNSGTLTLETTAWTNATTRATALATQDGVYCKTGALTRRYVGTFRASASNTTTDSSTKRFVWNYYNRMPRIMEKTISTATWDYTTATWRQMEASTANQVEFVIGVAVESVLNVQLQARSSNGAAGTDRRVGVGVSSTTAPSIVANVIGESTTAVYPHTINQVHDVGTGYFYYAMLEYSEAANTTTWYGADSVSGVNTTRLRVSGYF